MGLIKNEKQIKNITISCKILAEVKKVLYDAIKVGMTGIELDTIAEKEITKRGARPAFKGYMGFKNTICLSYNEEMIHGIPKDRPFEDGDIVKVDIGCVYQKMYSDSAFSKIIGKPKSRVDQKLVNVSRESFWAGVNAIKPGARIGDISYAIGQVIKKNGFFTPSTFSGHGIGTALHEEPHIPNDGVAGTGILIRDGMVICIEPMILQDSEDVQIQSDGWTVTSIYKKNTAHYEHTILIKDGKPIILTEGI